MITITQICQEAEIVRKTFYRHYNNKEEVLEEYIGDLYNLYLTRLIQLEKHQVYEVTKLFFQFWKEQQLFLEILYKNELMGYLLIKLEEKLNEMNKELPCKSGQEERLKEYAIAYSAGTYWRLLCKWTEQGMVETPEEIAQIHMKLVDQAMQ